MTLCLLPNARPAVIASRWWRVSLAVLRERSVNASSTCSLISQGSSELDCMLVGTISIRGCAVVISQETSVCL